MPDPPGRGVVEIGGTPADAVEEMRMAQQVAPVGPVDIVVVGFPEAAPDGRVTAAFADAVASGAVRVLDALVVEKSSEGQVNVIDVVDPAEALALVGYPTDLPGLLSAADADDVAADLPDGTSAVIIAWENVWAVRLQQALDAAGGVVALHVRIGTDELTTAIEAVLETTEA